MGPGWRRRLGLKCLGRRLVISLGKHGTVFQAEVYAILACVYENQMNTRPEKYVNICSYGRAALKSLEVGTTVPWRSFRRNLKRKIIRWVDNQHLVMWRGLSSSWTQAQKLFRVPVQLQRPDFCS